MRSCRKKDRTHELLPSNMKISKHMFKKKYTHKININGACIFQRSASDSEVLQYHICDSVEQHYQF